MLTLKITVDMFQCCCGAKGVLYGGYFYISVFMSVCQGEGERRKIPCIVLLKKALQASQEATP